MPDLSCCRDGIAFIRNKPKRAAEPVHAIEEHADHTTMVRDLLPRLRGRLLLSRSLRFGRFWGNTSALWAWPAPAGEPLCSLLASSPSPCVSFASPSYEHDLARFGSPTTSAPSSSLMEHSSQERRTSLSEASAWLSSGSSGPELKVFYLSRPTEAARCATRWWRKECHRSARANPGRGCPGGLEEQIAWPLAPLLRGQ